MLINFTVLNT